MNDYIAITAGLVLVAYTVVDKFLVPFLKSKLGNGKSTKHEEQFKHFEFRIRQLEKEFSSVDEVLQAVRTDLAVTTEIIQRIEKSIE